MVFGDWLSGQVWSRRLMVHAAPYSWILIFLTSYCDRIWVNARAVSVYLIVCCGAKALSERTWSLGYPPSLRGTH